jgi:hypothetical protein
MTNHENAPIQAYFGNYQDLGETSIPKALAYFWPHLSCEGKHISTQEYALLLQVLILRNSEREYRLSELPLNGSGRTRKQHLALLREKGIVFTKRLYYTPAKQHATPRVRSLLWDFRTLFYNLELISNEWKKRQAQLVDEWRKAGEKEAKPVYGFPSDFEHEMELPLTVALDILRSEYAPLTPYWHKKAKEALQKSQSRDVSTWVQDSAPTSSVSAESCTHEPQVPIFAADIRADSRTHAAQVQNPAPQLRVLEEEEEEGGPAARVFSFFREYTGQMNFQPTARDQAALWQRLSDGHSVEQIITTLERGAGEQEQPTFQDCLLGQEPTPGKVPHIPEKVLHFFQIVARRAPTSQEKHRLDWLATEVEAEAQKYGETGWLWVENAIQDAAGRLRDPEKLVGYATTVARKYVHRRAAEITATESGNDNATLSAKTDTPGKRQPRGSKAQARRRNNQAAAERVLARYQNKAGTQ